MKKLRTLLNKSRILISLRVHSVELGGQGHAYLLLRENCTKGYKQYGSSKQNVTTVIFNAAKKSSLINWFSVISLQCRPILIELSDADRITGQGGGEWHLYLLLPSSFSSSLPIRPTILAKSPWDTYKNMIKTILLSTSSPVHFTRIPIPPRTMLCGPREIWLCCAREISPVSHVLRP